MEECVFDNGRTCSILTTHTCEKCSFRKTKRELDLGRERALERIDGLPQDQRDAIKNKYSERNRP
jgi:hypothetical protein